MASSPTQEKFLSILIPTRDRFDMLRNQIEKLCAQIGEANLPLVEFIIKFDTDDAGCVSRIRDLPSDKVDIHVYVSDRWGGYKDVYRFYNQCARLSRGQLILMWNDDAAFATDNWFDILKAEATSGQGALSYWFAGTPTMVVEADGVTKGMQDWPCFIAHHRLFYEIIGFYTGTGSADSFIYYVLGPMNLLKKLDQIHVAHTAWFNIPLEQRDSVARDNAEPGQMLPTDFNVVRQCQQRIQAYAQRMQQRASGSPR